MRYGEKSRDIFIMSAISLSIAPPWSITGAAPEIGSREFSVSDLAGYRIPKDMGGFSTEDSFTGKFKRPRKSLDVSRSTNLR